MSTAVLSYTVIPYGQKTAAQLAVEMDSTNVPIPPGFLLMTGTTILSDTSTVSFGNAFRQVILDTSSAQFQAQFPIDQSSPFKGLLSGPISVAVNAVSVESLPT
jgi:hypothetical protein